MNRSGISSAVTVGARPPDYHLGPANDQVAEEAKGLMLTTR
jgi:hypothetical protein